MKRLILVACIAVLAMTLSACDFGQVEQGRAVAFDKATGVVSLMQDIKHDQYHPEYTGNLVTFKIPTNPEEMGPMPVAGGRLSMILEKKEVSIYNPVTKALQVVPVEVVDVRHDVKANSPLVKDKTFPVIDKAQSTVTVFSSRQSLIATLKVPADLLDLPADTWNAGDEIRIYYKQPGQALRLMNVTRTNIYKK